MYTDSRQTKSFAEISLTEAIARRARLDLVVDPVPPGNHKRLVSRLLGTLGAERLVLAVPTAKGRKVHVPVDWRLGMGFAVGEYFLQASTTVLDHCQFALYPTRRVDALVVRRPAEIAAVDRRQCPRSGIDSTRCVGVSLWPAECLAQGRATAPEGGRLVNQSPRGLGVRLEGPLPYPAGTEVLLRIEEPDAGQWRIVRAILKHCSQDDDGLWAAGLGDLAEVEPGEAVAMIQTMASAAQQPCRDDGDSPSRQ